MRIDRRRWSDEEVFSWAELYASNRTCTVSDLEESLGISHSTIWWGFTHRLEHIDPYLYERVSYKLQNIKKKGFKTGDSAAF